MTVPSRRNNFDIDDTSPFEESTTQRRSQTPLAASTSERVGKERGWYIYARRKDSPDFFSANSAASVNQICFRAKSIWALS